MAHAAKIASLTDELVLSIVNFDPKTNRQAYKQARELAARGLRGHQYARTNQFEVNNSFKGLDEKFRIKNRDDLADALHTRLQKFHDLKYKLKPELLSLLLHLADRPLENTDIRALDLLQPPSPLPPLTWSEILENDPYSDDEIWKDIDYGANSSEEDVPVVAQAKHHHSPATSLEDDYIYDVQSHLHPTDIALVESLRVTQFWNMKSDGDRDQTRITELQMIRETLHMLQGLPSHLYKIEERHDIGINSEYVPRHPETNAIRHVLMRFAAIGQDVIRLRTWTSESTSVPLTQAFQAAVRKRLLQYDQSLSSIHQRYTGVGDPLAVSLLKVHDEVQSISGPILSLARMLPAILSELALNPFFHLEALYEKITSSQLTLEQEIFHYMSKIFFECLQPYLRPIRQWMEDGALGSDNDSFFIYANDSGSDIGSLWHDRFVLRRDSSNSLRVPKFLHPAAKTILDTGKSVVFLSELSIEHISSCTAEFGDRLVLERTIETQEGIPISPFPELFAQAFTSWIGTRYSKASEVLRKHIFETDHLMRILDVFQTLYLGANGAVFENFAIAIFERMDSRRRGWNDRYVLTDLGRTIFAPFLHVEDVEKVVIRPLKIKKPSKSGKGLATISIDFALPWSIQNIIQKSSISIYQQLYIFLLRVYRIKYLLQSVRLPRTRPGPIHRIRYRLMWFIDIVRSYLLETAVSSTSRQMKGRMRAAKDIDEMARVHEEYTAILQTQTLLTRNVQPIYEAIIELLDLGVVFAERFALGGEQVKVRTKVRRGGDVSEDEEQSRTVDDSREAIEQSGTKEESMRFIDEEFDRLVPFVVAGLKSIGRAGAEPLYEQLAERLQWEGKKDSV